ncbi:protein of unknown function (DUF4328) [Promicromonospora umidemergens]|uniref:DUF4328 domain-containing protein n=1 Tax=Promicromonospora umidemergens TaxID=629679 RepID=A0ABP8XDU7_9MICO|nr:DUF4328 domain-containing protein [Promicromonospora umidemergens]MCP2282903.1 protein of unknown function (DUF4328) [Promicromonospora umidemergens]
MSHDPFAPPAGPVVPAPPAPVHHTYGAPLYSLPPLRSTAGLGTAAIVLACVWSAVQVLKLALAPAAADALREAAAAGYGAYDSAFTGYDLAAILSFAVQLATYIVTCLWLYTSRSTAVAATPGLVHQRSKVWAWLGWWVPIVSLWFPYQVVRDIRRATATGPVSGIGGWWAAWLVFVTLSNTAGRMTSRTTAEATATAAEALVFVELAATVGMVVALVLWIRMVRDVSRSQAERIAAARQEHRS